MWYFFLTNPVYCTGIAQGQLCAVCELKPNAALTGADQQPIEGKITIKENVSPTYFLSLQQLHPWSKVMGLFFDLAFYDFKIN